MCGQAFYDVAKRFAWLPKRIYRCTGPFSSKPSGTWVWLRRVDLQRPDNDAYGFCGLPKISGGWIALCGWGQNADALPAEDNRYVEPDRKRLIIGRKVVWEAALRERL